MERNRVLFKSNLYAMGKKGITMFQFFKKKGNAGIVIASPVKGTAISLQQVKDPTFSECMLGKGVAVLPVEGKIYAPADGEISLVFDTLHAVSMTTEDGVEILIHVGLDTVMLKGEGFTAHVATGDRVKKGDLLLTVDLDALKNAGYDTLTPMVICNTDDYADVQPLEVKEVEAGVDVLNIVK